VAAEGRRLVQETRGWVEEKGKTVSQRSKEYAHDYRYFPEPDLPPLVLNRDWVEEIRLKIPELPEARRDRFVAEYNLALYDANLLTSSRAMADYFEETYQESQKVSTKIPAKVISNWLLGVVSGIMNARNIDIIEFRKNVSPRQFVVLLDEHLQGIVSSTSGKSVLEEMSRTGKDSTVIITEQGLSQISDTSEIEEVVIQVINSNAQPVADFKAGKEQALKFLVGQVMKTTRGRANPKLVNELLKRKLEEG
jgi:aspartyl-tRNA(Asn)/glutamyl-tRNA(Gln) amidotransferase subunit B